MFAPQTNPAREERFLCVENQKGILMYCFDSRDVYHCPVLFSRSTDFSSPLRNIANFVVRVYVSIVAGGSLTMYILAQLLTTEILTSFPPHPQRSGMGSLGGTR